MRIQITALLVFMSFALSAQWSIGPKVSAGVITASESEIRIIPSSDVIPDQMSFIGGGNVRSIGFMAYNKIGPGFLQVDVLGTSYELQFATRSFFRTDENATVLNESRYIIEIPVTAGFNYKFLKVGVGPVLEINASKDSDLENLDRFVDKTDAIDGGFQGTIGAKFGNFHLDLRYVYRFNGITDEFGFGHDRLKLGKSANRLTLGLGVAF